MAENFDMMLKENSVYGRCTTSVQHWTLFVVSGMVMSWMPMYIYTSPMFDMTEMTQFVIVGTGAGLFLAWAYKSVSQKRRIHFLASHQMPSSKSQKELTTKKEKEEAQLAFESKTADTCCAYALFVVNGWFLVSWLLTAFYVIPKMSTGTVPAHINHIISICGPSALLAYGGKAVL